MNAVSTSRNMFRLPLLQIVIVLLIVFSNIIFMTTTVPKPYFSIFCTGFARNQHLPLTTRDTITNRCLLSTKETRQKPCRPFLGYVTKRFRSGSLPLATQVVISDAYRFAYVKTRKTAGTTIFYGYLRKNICPVREDDQLANHWWGKTKVIPVRANCSESLLAPSLESANRPPSITEIPIEKLQNFFVFTTARNPYERAVSSYEYCQLSHVGTFREFCERPMSFGRDCPAKPNNTNMNVTKANKHWDAQLPELCDSSGTNCVVDYVVDVSNITRMMDEVVEEINRRRNQSYPALPRFGESFTNLNVNDKKEEYAKYYTECEDCKDFIRDYYVEDLTMFGYKFSY